MAAFNPLLDACTRCNVYDIQHFLNLKYPPTEECFEELFMKRAIYELTQYDQNTEADNFASLIDLFISHGYELKVEDVTRLIRRGYYVNDIKRFNFNFDDEFYYACEMRCYWPYFPDVQIKIKNIMEVLCNANPMMIKLIYEQSDVHFPSISELYDYMSVHKKDVRLRQLRKLCEFYPITKEDTYYLVRHCGSTNYAEDVVRSICDKVKW